MNRTSSLDSSLASGADRVSTPAPPASAVPWQVGAAGLLGLMVASAIIWSLQMQGAHAIVTTLAGVALPMWWKERRRLGIAVPPISVHVDWPIRLRGMTLAALPWLSCLALFQWFYPAAIATFVEVLALIWPLLIVLGIASVLTPACGDATDILGRWVTNPAGAPPWSKLRDLTVKAFFLPLMATFLAWWWGGVNGVHANADLYWFLLPLALIYLIDVAFALVGYSPAPRAVGSEIRSSNPYLDGWLAALICYPPFFFWFKSTGVEYRSALEWFHHFSPQSWLLFAWGLGILLLTAVYSAATVAFGPRFSNLTNRGIITHGPYRWCRHPAYVSKNLTWWMTALPFLPVFGWRQALFQSLALLTINAVYWTRAVTEERHLLADVHYRRYYRYVSHHGLFKAPWRPLWSTGSDGRTVRRFLRRRPWVAPVGLLLLTLSVKPAVSPSAEAQLMAALREHRVPQAALFTPHNPERSTTFTRALEGMGIDALGVDQRFPIASLTKPLTALAMLQVVDQGVLSLDDPVVRWLPDFLPQDSQRHTLRIGHLLSHRSGLVTIGSRDPMLPGSAVEGPDCAGAIASVAAIGEAPGGRSRYQNINYCVLQRVLEAATGRPFTATLSQAFPVLAEDIARSASDSRFCASVARLGASGGLCLQPERLLWILSEGVRNRAAMIASPLQVGEEEGYGLGWRVWRHGNDQLLFTHFGYLQGHFSVVVASAEGKVAALLLRQEIADPHALFARLRPVLFALMAQDADGEKKRSL